MANISIGYGTAIIYAKNLREIAELAYLQDLGEKKSYYYTTLTEVDELGYILNSDENTLGDKNRTWARNGRFLYNRWFYFITSGNRAFRLD